MRKLSLALFLILVMINISPIRVNSQSTHRQLVKIRLDNKESFRLLEDMNLDLASHRIDQFAEAVVTDAELAEINKRGFSTQEVILNLKSFQTEQYRSYEEIVSLCEYYASEYPEILMLDTLGYSQVLNKWMPVIKISDNPDIEEDEAAVLYDGLHHAREPVGMESLIHIMEHILKNYGSDEKITQWVNDFEIWFIPIINPDGYDYLIRNNLTSPWWRKNFRDNDDDGIFNPDIDGVDLNRNYDYNWDQGGGSDPSSWTYRGSAPFSESEVAAKRDLSLEQKFLLCHTYHSHGEIVIYPWSNMDAPPDFDLIKDIAQGVASRIPSITGNGTYDAVTSSGMVGYSKNWMYAVAGTIEFTVETAREFMPSVGQGMQIAQSNLDGGLYLLERMEGPGVTGHVIDQSTGNPIPATVRLLGADNDLITPRTADSSFGRFWRLLLPGKYSMRFSMDGYESQNVHNIEVNDSLWTELNVEMNPVTTGFDELIVKTSIIQGLKSYPNPFENHVDIKFTLAESGSVEIGITDLSGRTIALLSNTIMDKGPQHISWNGSDQNGNDIPSGYYFISISTRSGNQQLRIMKVD